MLSIIWFILILGSIVAIHEFGHFIFAKLANIYVYEFSIGMGKKIFGKKKKGAETEFCVRALPLGGYVMIAGEDVEDKKIPKDRQMCNKNFIQRFLVLFAGPLNNFIFAFIILLISAFIYGAVSMTPYVSEVMPDFPAVEAGMEPGDLLLEINGEKIKSWDRALLKLQVNQGETIAFKVQKNDGEIKTYNITPIEVVDEEGNSSYKFGIAAKNEKEYGFFKSIKYAFTRTISLFVNELKSKLFIILGS